MQIILENTGRRFNKEWIFRNLSFSFTGKKCYGVTGSNGSGKSTFIQMISGHLSPSEGKIRFENDSKTIVADKLYRDVSICSPMTELYEELTLSELVKFHVSLKPLKSKMTVPEFCKTVFLEKETNKPVRLFSSGMKQRVKLGLAILSDTPLLLLDEPCSNFDAAAVTWYKNLLSENAADRIVIVASNKHEDELFSCEHLISIENYK